MTRLLSSLILGAVMSCAVQGAPACVAQAYSNFLAAGFECEINAAVFSNFSFSTMESGPNMALDASEITVSPLSSASRSAYDLQQILTPAAVRMGPVPLRGS